MTTAARRELTTRNATWAKQIAAALARAGARPNAISFAGVFCAACAALGFAVVPHAGGSLQAGLLVFAAAAIQLRLLCNLLDGMLAIEHGMEMPTGVLYNEIPDRIADVLVLTGAGLSISPAPGGVALGCAAALGALFTAYVRVLGGSLTNRQHFIGPMAKPHRMFVLTVAALAGAVQAIAGMRPSAIAVGLVVIAAGSLVTAARRLSHTARELEGR